MKLLIIGIDLAVKGRHTAALFDPAGNRFLMKRYRFRSRASEMEKLLRRAQQEADEETKVAAVLEATGMSWFEVGQYLHRRGVEVYRVNGRQTKDLRRVSWRHARSDKLDSQTLARLPVAAPKEIDIWTPPSGDQLALQRLCREMQRLTLWQTAIQQRLQSLDQWSWGGLEKIVPAACRDWVRVSWYDPFAVWGATEAYLTVQVQAAFPNVNTDWVAAWVERAREMVMLYQDPEVVGYKYLAEMNQRELERFEIFSEMKRRLWDEHLQPLYHQLYPNDVLLTLKGVGERSAAIYHGFILDIERFPNGDAFAQWTGMTPRSNQSGEAHSKRMPLSKQGPNLIKTTLYQNANVARLWDVQLANIYYTQMVHYGKTHTQAVCAVASHLARRIYAILRDQRPYQFRNLDGQPISPEVSRSLILEHFQVPPEIRQQRRKRRLS